MFAEWGDSSTIFHVASNVQREWVIAETDATVAGLGATYSTLAVWQQDCYTCRKSLCPVNQKSVERLDGNMS